mmetsp:Transcript_28093/g.56955  ORF Transcript_28093/g.56955 Transcript_28093/m.56955 type:complete len:88 (+) Transcript_28093:185-448(+)
MKCKRRNETKTGDQLTKTDSGGEESGDRQRHLGYYGVNELEEGEVNNNDADKKSDASRKISRCSCQRSKAMPAPRPLAKKIARRQQE